MLLVLQQLSGLGNIYLAPLLVFALFLCFAGAITTWAPITLDLLRRPSAMTAVLTALPAAQALSAGLIGLLMQVLDVVCSH